MGRCPLSPLAIALACQVAWAGCLPQALMCASPRDPSVQQQELLPKGLQLGPLRLEQDPESHAMRLAPALDLGKHTHLSVKMNHKDVGLRLKFNTD
ncbi:hypothetical protein [Chromobacterium sphagni]|uniref:Uncharacterized protein n=1 Tax=Chromobacterium sphagni TaxID=1903179 RepID=A0A1S1X0N1_9NEIS|nr:hypothetical protein [Chromobacterium sphagni]OHX12979.1 hypothetical protein BI347_05225 [Chromobacterium sphagni]OHX19249.1 hypothetical protein BI344_08965 [Chromobacterium sphagni]